MFDEELTSVAYEPVYFVPVTPAAVPGSLPVDGATQAELLEAGYTFEGIETYALSPITSSTGLKGILLELLGPYDNIVTQYQYRQNTSSNYSYVNEITPDFPWIFSAVLFIVLVWSVFRLLGVLLGWLK